MVGRKEGRSAQRTLRLGACGWPPPPRHAWRPWLPLRLHRSCGEGCWLSAASPRRLRPCQPCCMSAPSPPLHREVGPG